MLNQSSNSYLNFKTVYQGEELSFDLHYLLSDTAKFQTSLISYSNSYYVLKNFAQRSEEFHGEARFQKLCHPRLATPLLASSGFFSSFSSNTPEFYFTLSEYCSNGDLTTLLIDMDISLDEKMARYYFRQLVEGVEYMHSMRIAHLDIKPCNVFLDENFNLKLGDFDFSSFEGDGKFEKGSEGFRAPEVIVKNNYNIYKADIYSIGIMLFSLLVGKYIPFYESCPKLQRLLYESPRDYWRVVEEKCIRFHGKFSDSFKLLFEGMTKEKPEDRWSLDEIRASKWYNDEVYAEKDIKEMLESLTHKNSSPC
jgi:serine/threonine protein kinase